MLDTACHSIVTTTRVLQGVPGKAGSDRRFFKGAWYNNWFTVPSERWREQLRAELLHQSLPLQILLS